MHKALKVVNFISVCLSLLQYFFLFLLSMKNPLDEDLCINPVSNQWWINVFGFFLSCFVSTDPWMIAQRKTTHHKRCCRSKQLIDSFIAYLMKEHWLWWWGCQHGKLLGSCWRIDGCFMWFWRILRLAFPLASSYTYILFISRNLSLFIVSRET